MARTGNFGGFVFDEEVFASMMNENDFWRNEIAASGIVQQDSTIMDLIGTKGNVATIPIYKPLNIFEDGQVVTPVELIEAGIIKNIRDGVKIMGNGELTKKLTVVAAKFTATAKEKIEAVGGKAEVI